MTLHLAKGRRALVYRWPLPEICAGTTWEAEFPVWAEDGTPADLTGATINARIWEGRRDNVRATGTVTTPSPGLIAWSFPAVLADDDTEVFRFTLDVTTAGGTQRLIDSALPVRGGWSTREVAAPPPSVAEGVHVSGAQTLDATTQTSAVFVFSAHPNPVPWEAVPWPIPVLDDPDIGKRIATGSLLLPSSITDEAWNGPESHYNPMWRDDANRQVFIYDPGQTFSGYDMRGWSVFVTGNANNTIIRDCLFDSNSKSGATQLWWGAVYTVEGATGLAIEYCDFIGDKVTNAGRGHAFIRAADNPAPLKRIHRCKFMQSSNDAVEVPGCTDGITHNYFYGMGYQDESHGDCITVARTFCPTVIEYNHFDSYGDGDFGTQVDPVVASTQSNSVRSTDTSGPNILGVTCRFNTHKGGAFQVEPVFTATCKNFVFHDEYRLLRWGAPHYSVNRSATDNYQGPWGDIDEATFGGALADQLRYYNQIEVDYDGAGNDRALTSINGVTVLRPGPTFFGKGVYAQPEYMLSTWTARGINTFVEVPQGSDPATWAAAVVAAGKYMIRPPLGTDSETPTSSFAITDMAAFNADTLTNVLAMALMDEPSSTAGSINYGEVNFDPDEVDAIAATWRAGKPGPIWCNHIGNHVNSGAPMMPDYMDSTVIDWYSHDCYPVQDGLSMCIDLDGYFSTRQGHAIDRMITWSGGKPQMAFIGTSKFSASNPETTAGQFRVQCWSSIIHGAWGIAYFTFVFDPAFAWDGTPPALVTEIATLHAAIDSIHATLMDPAGGRRPFRLRRSASSGNTPTADEMPYPFEGVEIDDSGGTYKILLNLSATAETLTYAPWGISAQTYAGYEVAKGYNAAALAPA